MSQGGPTHPLTGRALKRARLDAGLARSTSSSTTSASTPLAGDWAPGAVLTWTLPWLLPQFCRCSVLVCSFLGWS